MLYYRFYVFDLESFCDFELFFEIFLVLQSLSYFFLVPLYISVFIGGEGGLFLGN